MKKDWGNVLILPTRESEAGYGLGYNNVLMQLESHESGFLDISETSSILPILGQSS